MSEKWTIEQYAAAIGVNEQRARLLCRAGRVPGARQKIAGGHCIWEIPAGSVHPAILPPGKKPKEKRPE
jgi:hypothetical protein